MRLMSLMHTLLLILWTMDNDDWDELMELHFLLNSLKQTHYIKFQHQRIDWDCHIHILQETDEFHDRFKMPKFTFGFLLEEIRDPLTVSESHSMASTSGVQPIYPEVMMDDGMWNEISCLIRFCSNFI